MYHRRETVESLSNIGSTTRPLTSSMQVHQHRAYCNVGSGIRSYSRTTIVPFRNSSTTTCNPAAAFFSSVFETPFQRTARSFASSPAVDNTTTISSLVDDSEANDRVTSDGTDKQKDEGSVKVEKVKVAACGDVDSDDDSDDDDDELEMEEMFVDAHPSFGHKMVEWGGPRRGGRFPEPTRYGDWERKGRCSDF